MLRLWLLFKCQDLKMRLYSCFYSIPVHFKVPIHIFKKQLNTNSKEGYLKDLFINSVIQVCKIRT